MGQHEDALLAESRRREHEKRLARVGEWAAFHGRQALQHYQIARQHVEKMERCKKLLREES